MAANGRRKAFLIRSPASSSGPARVHLFDKEGVTIGRSPEADVMSFSLGVSRIHLLVTARDGAVEVEDKSSANGTRIDGVAIASNVPMALAPTAQLSIGDPEECYVIERIDVPLEIADVETRRASLAALVQDAVEGARLQAQAEALVAGETAVKAARLEAAALVLQARREAEVVLARAAQVSREKMEQSAHDQASAAERALESARGDAAEIILQAHREADVVIAKAAQAGQDKANLLISGQQAAGERAAALARSEAREQGKDEGRLLAAHALEDAALRSAAILAAAKRKSDDSEADLRNVEDRLRTLELEASEAAVIAKKAREQADEFVAARMRAQAELSALVAEAGKVDVRIQADLLQAKNETLRVQAELLGAQAEMGRVQSGAREAQSSKERVLLEISALGKHHENEAAELRVGVIEEAKARMREDEKQVQALRRHQVAQMTQQMEIFLVPRLKEHLKSAGGTLEALRSEIRDVADRVLTGDNSTVVNEIERVAAYEPEPKERSRRATYAFIAGFGAFAIWAFVFPSQLKAVWQGAFGDTSGRSFASLEADQVLKEKRRKEKFLPPQIDVYQSSYVDNVLYMTGYSTAKLNPVLQDKWILDLNRLFANEMKLHENAVVSFISIEAGLVRQLNEMKDSTDGRFANESIAKMRAVESAERAKMVALLKGEGAYAHLREFERNELVKFKAEPR